MPNETVYALLVNARENLNNVMKEENYTSNVGIEKAKQELESALNFIHNGKDLYDIAR